MNIVERDTVEEADIFLRSWWRIAWHQTSSQLTTVFFFTCEKVYKKTNPEKTKLNKHKQFDFQEFVSASTDQNASGHYLVELQPIRATKKVRCRAVTRRHTLD